MNTSEVLNKAADLIEERGWTKGCVGMIAGGSGPVCLEGSLGRVADVGTHIVTGLSAIPDGTVMVSHYSLMPHPAYKAVRDYLAVEYPELWRWNDRLTSSLGENLSADDARDRVVSVLRAAALIEAAKESAAVQVPAEVVA